MRRLDLSGCLLILIIIGVLWFGSCFAEVADNMPFKVRSVRFAGVAAIDQSALADSLAANPPPFWKFWEPHPVIYPKDVEDDTFRIKQFYQAEGYYQTTIEYDISPAGSAETLSEDRAHAAEFPDSSSIAENKNDSETDRTDEYDIIFHIEEGLPVIIDNISIVCDCELETISNQEILDILPLKTGRIFKTEEYDQSKILMRKLLGNRAYPFVKVTGNATVDLNDHSADIAFNIDAGQLYNFGDIRITGHEDYVRENVIRRAITFESGEAFSTKKLDESRRNLFDLNIFKTAMIQMGEPPPGENAVPIDIMVNPRKKQSVKLGVGYGTDDGLRLQAGWSYRNLTGRADRLTVRARHSEILENIYAEYLLPYFLSDRNNLLSTSGFEREEKDYFTLNKTSTEINLYRKLDARWDSAIGYNLENNRPEDIRVEDSEELIDPRDTESYFVSAVKFSVHHSTVDDVLNSRKGSVVTISIENASDYLGSEISYIRPEIEAKVFVPLPWDMVLASRMNIKTIQESGNTDYIPISRQFFLGGSKSVRGFGFEKLGVIDKNDVIRDISGLSSFVGNFELRFPIYKDFGGVVFLDTGALYKDTVKVNLNSLRYTSGLGLRYNTIIGPIQLDFGYQLNPAKSTASDDPLLTDLLNKDRWYLHFNIGQTF